ncbi:probable LRR receptor-like serine/threonine-protein kinase At1g06840 isoform X2 [Punica granatum]|uniref:non-specific serine/threonine protein kinase n=1 Tax=Punica granatum TaxID=22663 RepID=A0A6P8BNB6_PUNGR|nr:probable LRR receptor-like serine/threonine-protein kinase At1g06840 isoform X2 [Punica granatum]
MVRCRLLLLGILVALVAFCFAQPAFGQITQREEVIALRAVRRQLKDPRNRLRNWRKGDPCTSNWTGVVCYFNPNDGYLHVQELRLIRRNLSGNLAPELGRLAHMTILDFMFNNISGSIPKEIGNMTSLNLLLLSGNQISGPLPDELGYLPNITRFQLDLNNISGPLPKSFANLPKALHFHMNNNSISGQIPPELHKLPQLVHFLLDNNNLSGYLPPELSRMPKLRILQVDNNNFEGTEIPQSYTNMSNLLKLSLRNCKLQGTVPDFGTIPKLLYLDLSHNKLNGTIPTNRLYTGITTIDLSNNQLGGTIPSNFSGLPRLQNLSLENNFLSGDVPTDIWQNRTFASVARLVLNFRSNALTDLAGSLNPPSNVTIMLEGNPICRRANELNIANSCGNQTDTGESPPRSSNNTCPSAYLCPVSGGYELVPDTPVGCNCSAPVRVGFLLRSPSISDFPPYFDMFRHYITSNLHLDLYQLQISTPFIWEEGPRLRLFLKFHPHYTEDHFNETALQDLVNKIATYSIPGNDTFGPYDLLNFTFRGPYEYYDMIPTSSSMNKGVLAAIVLGSIACGGIIIMAMAFVFYTIRRKKQQDQDREKQTVPKIPMKIDGIKGFSFKELEEAASNFEITSQIGQGGYGKVYKGTLADGSVVAIKRAQRGSLQGQKEFFTEIELLSRLHHRNLVSLIGYCDEQSEQMLVYEFMANGSLHDLLSDDAARHGSPLNFVARLRTALGAAKGILYLHTEADPPIIHRDIKANNILLDSKFNAKVSDFGISRLFPEADADASVSAHVFTYVKGTPGYVDPEYFQTHKLTEKSDVYSLGIVFLELLTGMRPIYHGKHIVQEVLVACRAGLMFSTIDRRMGPYPADRVKKFMAMALKCCEEEGKDRPTMLEVVRELENITVTLPQSDTVTPESDTSSSATSGSILSSIYGRDSYTSSNFQGSDLVSGVIPTIRPR